MVLYDYDRNVILSEPMKSRRDAEMERALKNSENTHYKGVQTKILILDNESPAALK